MGLKIAKNTKALLASAAGVATLAGLLAAGPALGAEDDRIGVAAAVKGQVQLVTARAEPHLPASGESLFMGDRVVSGPASSLQILLLDKTTFTLGADCDLTINRFVYDPETSAGEIRASVSRGAFRFVTGNIPHRDPDALTIDIPSGTIGVRGTIGEAVVGSAAVTLARESGIDVSGVDPDRAVLVLLRGPGQNLNTGDRIGQIDVTSGGETTVLARPNRASFIGSPSAVPSPAFEIPAALQGALRETIHPKRSASQAEEEDTASAESGGEDENSGSGTTVAEGGVSSESASAASVDGEGSVSENSGEATVAGADLATITVSAEEQQLAATVGTQLDATDSTFADGPTRPEDFLSRQGTATYASNGHAMTGGGSYNYNSTVNFDTRSWNSTATWSGTAAFDNSLSATGQVDLSGNVVSRSISQNYGIGQDATLNEQIMNKNGVVAGAIQHNLTVTDSGGPVSASGSGIAQ